MMTSEVATRWREVPIVAAAQSSSGWVNQNPGWIALIAAGAVGIVTAVYVRFTWMATNEAHKANDLARRRSTTIASGTYLRFAVGRMPPCL
jgi:hypothetical protein